MKRDYPKLIGMLLVVASVSCIIVLFIADISVIFEPPYLLPVTNTIFTAIIPIIVAFFAARTYLKSGSLSVFLMGCGMLSFGISAALAGWLRPAQNGANINVTIYNTGALVGSLFHISGAVLSSFGRSPQWRFERGKLVVASAYCGVFAFIILFTFATFEQIIPPFFIQGSGPTALRQIVLGLAIFFYLLSAIFFMDNYLKIKSDFFYWYSLGLAMLALGLFAFYIQKGVGSPIGWAGRTTNYIGAIFTLVAILTAIRSGRSKGLTLEDVISGFFMDAEASYRSLVETVTDAIISYDQEDRIILWNTGAERIFGYTKGEAIGAPFFKLLIPEEYSSIVRKIVSGSEYSPLDRSNLLSAAEIETKKRDGSLLLVEIFAFSRQLPRGLVSTCIVRDITERKRAEQALRVSEAKFKALADTSPLAIYMSVGIEQKADYINPTFFKLFGYSSDEVPSVEQWWLRAYPDEKYRQQIVEEWQRRVRHAIKTHSEVKPMDVIVTCKDGSQKNISWGYISFGKQGWGFGIDLTERKQAEDALRKSEERFRQLADSTFEGILIHDKGVILDVNQALTRLTGYDYEEAIGKDVFTFIAPESKEVVLHRIQYPDVAPFEISLIKKDRTTCLVEVAARSINYGGKMARVVALRDITERKRAEEVIKKRTEQLEEANKELESFSYSVSHDLRAPLRAIDGYARMILKKQGDKFDEDTRRRFNEIRLNTQMMGKLVDDLLDFSRLGRKNMSMSKIDMEALIGDVWKELQVINPDRNINLTVKNMPPIYGDRTLIKQVYSNLLANAVKFTKFEDPAQIEVGGHVNGNEDIYYVKDNGVGFDMQYYDKLFGVFQRLHKPDDFEGTGIGLATVHRIINRHGGRVWAEGKEGEGATFYFSLPPPQTH